MERGEFPQVGHIDWSPVPHQELGDLVVSIGAGIVKGNQATKQKENSHKTNISAKLICIMVVPVYSLSSWEVKAGGQITPAGEATPASTAYVRLCPKPPS